MYFHELNAVFNSESCFGDTLARPGSKRSIFQTSFLGLLSVLIHSNEVGKGQIAQNMMKIGLKGQ